MKKNETMVLCDSSGMVQMNKMTALHKSVGLYILFGTLDPFRSMHSRSNAPDCFMHALTAIFLTYRSVKNGTE